MPNLLLGLSSVMEPTPISIAFSVISIGNRH
jgi:hypothetical protein